MVSRILEDLRAEHRTMRKLLEMLQRQIELVADDRPPNGDLLLEITEYFRSYPDLFHHPKEELILRRVADRNPGALQALATLEEAHEDCSRELGRFSRAVVRLLIEPHEAEGRFLSAALAFVEREHRQMTWEDEQLFTLAERSLNDNDWTQIEASLTSLADPAKQREAQCGSGHLGRTIEGWRTKALPDPRNCGLRPAVRGGNSRVFDCHGEAY